MERIGKIIFKITAIILSTLPEAITTVLIRLSAISLFAFSPGKRRNVRRNLSIAGMRREEITNRHIMKIFENQTRNTFELFASTRWSDEKIAQRFTIEGKEIMDEAVALGRGTILVSPHVGNWELAAIYLNSLGYKLYVVAGVQLNRLLTGAVREVKEKRGIEVISPDDSYRKFFKALKSNGIIALLLDGDVYTSSVRLKFFGRETDLPRGPVSLSRKSGAPIVGGYCRRLKNGRFHIFCEKILDGKELEEISNEEAKKKVYNHMENYIKMNLDEWCIFRNIWG